MKKIFAAVILALTCISLSAQAPQGGRGGGRPPGGPGGEGGRPPMGARADSNEAPWIMKLPEISNLTLDQRTKLVDALSKEQADMSKLIGERQSLKIQIDNNPELTSKELQKITKKIDKVNTKIGKSKAKYDKKYRSILSLEQYQEFETKRKDIKFGNPRRPEGMKSPNGEQRPEPRHDDDQAPFDMPDNMD